MKTKKRGGSRKYLMGRGIALAKKYLEKQGHYAFYVIPHGRFTKDMFDFADIHSLSLEPSLAQFDEFLRTDKIIPIGHYTQVKYGRTKPSKADYWKFKKAVIKHKLPLERCHFLWFKPGSKEPEVWVG